MVRIEVGRFHCAAIRRDDGPEAVQTTIFTILPGTTITFFGTAPATNSATFGSVNAARSISSRAAETETSIVPRSLPLTCTASVTESFASADASARGQA